MRFVHTADNHLDIPLTSLSPEKAMLRRAQRLSSFSKIIDYTIKYAHMLIISGDLFHSPTPPQSVVDFCIKEFKRLGSIPVFISLGNHDYNASFIDFPGNVHIFPCDFERFSHKNFTVTGASFSSSSESFEDKIPPAEKNGLFNILCLHGDISANSPYNPLNKDYISALGYDYVALGHIHGYLNYKNIFYPGCHDGAGFDETGEKTFIFGDFSNSNLKIERIPSSSFVYRIEDFDISDFSSSIDIANALAENFSSGIYRFNLTGIPKEGFIPNTESIESYISSSFFSASVHFDKNISHNYSESIVYKLFSEYITAHCDEEIASLALGYGFSALKGDILE